jgi:hypothetical protein
MAYLPFRGPFSRTFLQVEISDARKSGVDRSASTQFRTLESDTAQAP